MSEEESKQIIAGLGEKIDDRLNWNPGTPRSLLGIAAPLVQEPDVVVYSTVALDLEGCWKVHRFITSKSRQFCAVHISFPGLYGNGTPHPRECPTGAKCIQLAADSPDANSVANPAHGNELA
jgi:hypothetical protein